MTVSTSLADDDALPRGFSFGGLRCGIKQGRPDLGLVRSDRPATAAAVLTRNPARAACIDRNAGLVPSARVTAVLVNSGNANAMTGTRGERANEEVAHATARALDVDPSEVLTLSTGVIGVPLPVSLITRALPTLVAEAGATPMPFARAILTTDTVTKIARTEVLLPGVEAPVVLLGIAKGSGMIHPNMATTLGIVCTDAAIAPHHLQALLRQGADETFNAICVDGDTSTNDAVTVLANGASGIHVESPDAVATFGAALKAVMASLARQVALDGEGATRLLEVEVRGAPDDPTARLVARGVCRSSLVKCSTFAGHPDWGRIAAAVGQAALEHELAVDPKRMSIAVQGITLFEPQGPCADVDEQTLDRRMREATVRWTVDLGDGPGRALGLGCDLSYDYVRINADEAQTIEVGDDGLVRRNPGLASYSPRLKHLLLVDGLAYVRRFMGLRMMVVVPAPPTRADVVDTLAEDLELCLDANLRPLLVVPTEAMAHAVQEHLRSTGHFVATVTRDAVEIGRMLDRGHLCVMVQERPTPADVVDLAIELGMHKLIAMTDAQGLRDARGLVPTVSSQGFPRDLEQGRFASSPPDLVALAERAVDQGVPALHLIDLRLPHALVGELFTDEGIGTLVTRQAVG